MKQLLVIFFSLISISCIAQDITGPTSVYEWNTVTYEYYDGFMGFDPNFNIIGGTKINESFGTPYTVEVQWGSTGTGTVQFRNGESVTQELYVTISVEPPATPSTTFSTVQYCGYTEVTRNSNPGYLVRWYWQTSSTGTSTALGYSSSTSPTASGDLWLRANREDHPSVWSGSSLYVGNISVISSAPSPGSIGGNVSICAGASGGTLSNATSVSGDGITALSWEQSTNGVNWSIISGAYATTYATPNISNTTYYKRGVNNICGTTYSNTITITVYSSLSPGTIGGAQTICYNSAPSALTNTATPSGSTGSYSYQWESRPSGGSWSNIGGATSSTYSPGALTTNTDYRRKASTSCESLYSNTITVTVYAQLQGGSIGSNQTVCTGSSPAALTNTASASGGNASYSYQWEQSANGSSWSNASGSSTSATYSPPSISSATYYRRKVTSCGATAYTGNVLISVDALSVGGTVSASIEAYGIASGSFTLSGHTGAIQKWQKKEGAGSWTDITNTTTTLSYTNVTTTTTYRAVVKNGTCNAVNSSESTVTIYAVPTVNIVGNSAIPPAGSTQLVATSGLYSYQWYKNNVVIAGATANTLTVTKPAAYKVSVKTTSTSPVYQTGETIISGTKSTPLQDLNYVTTTIYNIPGATAQTDLYDLPAKDFSQQTNYFDGLGRAIQSVSLGAGGNGTDLIQPVAYDGFGREAKKYLPYTHNVRDGRYQPAAITTQAAFYNTGSTTIPIDSLPFAKTMFEPSPLNRPAKNYGPGQAWGVAENNKFIEQQYLLNVHGTGTSSTAEKVIAWKLNSSGLPIRNSVVTDYVVSGGYYQTGQLTVNKTIDEQGNSVREYQNKEGQIILKKVQVTAAGTSNLNDLIGPTPGWALTYYIYDDLGNLRYVLPPELSKIVHQNDSYNPSTADINNWAFLYKYDERKRMKVKKVPGADSVYMVYDKRDRLVLTQDGNQRAGSPKYWSFTKYDELNRPVLTGIKDTAVTLSQAQMQSVVNSHYSKAWAKLGESYIGSLAGNLHGYSNKSYPVITGPVSTIDKDRYLSVTYYDNYLFKSIIYDSAQYSFKTTEISGEQDASYFKRLTGQVTGTKTKVLDGGVAGGYTWLKSVNYYDDNYHVIQTVADNYKGGVDRVTNVYDFTGKVLKSKSTHNSNDLLWVDKAGVGNVGNKLVRNNGTSGWGTAGATSAQILPAGVDGWMEVTASEGNIRRMIGLNDTSPDQNYTNINYTFYLSSDGKVYLYENGSSLGFSAVPYKSGDVLRIQRTGTSVVYKMNGSNLFTSTIASSTALLVDASINENGGTLMNVNSSFTQEIKSLTRTLEYDHAGRLTKTWHQLDTQPEILLAKNEYNELGQLVDKKLHSTLASGANAKQSVDYRYNIRGWLTKMNESDLTGGDSGDARDLFGMQLGYNEEIGVSNTGLFNGNISAIKWSSNLALGSVKENATLYTYDPLNRISTSMFKEKSSSWSTPSNSAFAETGFTYDLNGNILTLQRNDKRSSGWMDNLAYTYSLAPEGASNKLRKVADSGDDFKGFMDGADVDVEYMYDGNGNMTTDLNKGITTAIVYNFLNLPELVNRGIANNVRYIYDATGRKLAQVATYNSVQKQTDYVGEYQYENDVLQFLSHEEGRIVLTNTKMIFTHNGDATTNITASTSSLSAVSINGSTYISAYANGTTSKQGMFPIGGTFSVQAGERYLIRAKGYRTSSNSVYLNIRVNGTDVDWPGATLASSQATEAWIEQTVTIPAGGTTLQAGVIWNTTANSQIFYLNEFEIIKLESQAPEYQYNLKDHLGNVRLTFTTKQEEETTIATLETANAATEQSQFIYYNEAVKINSPLFDHTNNGATTYATRLTGGTTNEKYGLAKSISVMPGDTLNIEVFAKYLDPTSTNWNAALQAFIASIQPGGGAPAGTFIDGGAAGSIGSQTFPYIGTLTRANDNGTGPKGYLNYILFDRNFVYKTGGFQRISSTPKETGTDVAHERLAFDNLVITEPGYIYIYLSNENETPVEVFFDDFKVEHIKSPVIQTDDYYPFGLTFNSYSRENSTPNKFKFQGQEHVDDLGLNWDAFKWRNHQPDIGRFFNIDPLADKYVYNSPYAFSENRVIDGIELEGLEVVLINPKRSEKDKTISTGAQNITDKSAIHVVAHGNNKLMANDVDGTKIRTAGDLNKTLTQKSDDWKNKKEGDPMTIVLHSCNTGADGKDKDGNPTESFAQKISGSEEFKDVTIIAPDQRVWTNEDGEVGTYETEKSTDKNGKTSETRSNKEGTWNVFKNGKQTGQYDGDWSPKANPGMIDNALHKKDDKK